ncbi:hypothetical protein KSP40_PGU000637 [Platanthera guangdongensis]|uniref:Mitochondrial carrier protein n=1 Tax=Platanthera guangdongensis TaxID=2320717 RepID=A0ABR2MII1_9ASPA
MDPIVDVDYSVDKNTFSRMNHIISLRVNPVKYNSIFSGLNLLVKEQGASSLWRGWSGKLFGYGAQGGCKFGLYEYFKKMYADLMVGHNQTMVFFASSASAQIIADVALCPFEAVKIRVQTQPHFARGLADGMPKLYAYEGLSGGIPCEIRDSRAIKSYIWSGSEIACTFHKHVPSFWCDAMLTSYCIINFMLSNVPVPETYLKKREECSRAQQLGITSVAGYISGAIGTVISTPADNIISSLYNKKSHNVVQGASVCGNRAHARFWDGCGRRADSAHGSEVVGRMCRGSCGRVRDADTGEKAVVAVCRDMMCDGRMRNKYPLGTSTVLDLVNVICNDFQAMSDLIDKHLANKKHRNEELALALHQLAFPEEP